VIWPARSLLDPSPHLQQIAFPFRNEVLACSVSISPLEPCWWVLFYAAVALSGA